MTKKKTPPKSSEWHFSTSSDPFTEYVLEVRITANSVCSVDVLMDDAVASAKENLDLDEVGDLRSVKVTLISEKPVK